MICCREGGGGGRERAQCDEQNVSIDQCLIPIARPRPQRLLCHTFSLAAAYTIPFLE